MMKTRTLYNLVALLSFLWVAMPSSAYAVCNSPSGNPGAIIYNATEKQFSYCKDNVWTAMNNIPGSGAGGCTLPTVAEGQMSYNVDHRVLQGCAGNVHRTFGPVGGLMKWKSVSVGGSNGCGIQNDGSLWCWGEDGSSQLGNGPGNTPQDAPMRVGGGTNDWESISVGADYGCAIKTDKSLWCWGSDSWGRLGNGTGASNQQSPMREDSNANNWKVVSTGTGHTCAVKNDGSLWCWGDDGQGQLGNGAITGDQHSPMREDSNASNWESVSTGGSHTCAIKTDGTLWCWGGDALGQLGNGAPSNQTSPMRESSNATNWRQVSAGFTHSCAIKTDGSLWCWGSDTRGELGNGPGVSHQQSPVRETTNANDWKNVNASNANFTCATKTDGSLWCWGASDSGQLGNGVLTPDQHSPVREATNANNWESIATFRSNAACAIKTDGGLWCWGSDRSYRLGNGTATGDQPAPAQESSNAYNWKNISAGQSHTCAVKTDGSLWCWGFDGSGQLGNGATSSDQDSPTRESTNATNWSFVDAGQSHTCAVKTDGSLWCWGLGGNGQLGHGSTGSTVSPVRESSNATDWTQVSAGSTHTCAVKTDGSLWCWGSDGQGQLGNGGAITGNQVSPVREVSNATDWVQVSTGYSPHTCAVKTDGSLWCWGTDTSAQLGNGVAVTSNQDSPMREDTNATDWVQVSAKSNYTCAIKTNGELWCWGANGQYQLGHNLGIHSPGREKTNATNWAQVSTAGNHTCGVKTDGSVWCWGYNRDWQVSNRAVAALQSELIGVTKNVKQVAAGGSHTCAIKTDDSVVCWGSNVNSQLGFPSYSSVPLRTNVCNIINFNEYRGGALFYNTDHKLLQYCDGVSWVGVAGGVGLPVDPPPPTMPSSGLVAYWKFDETTGSTTAADSSGNGITGTLTNMDPATDWVTGRVGNALDFDGSNDRVSFVSNALLNNMADRTVCMWTYPRNPYSGWNAVMSKYDPGYGVGWDVYLSGSATSQRGVGINQTNTATSGSWQHFCATRTGSTMKIFKNGVEQPDSLSAYPGGGDDSGQNLAIGSQTNGDDAFDGLIDEVRIYNRVLTQPEIQTLADQ